jgi:beta-xylosidase
VTGCVLARFGALLLLLVGGSAVAKDVPSVIVGADPDAIFADGAMWIYPTGPGDRLDAWSSADRRHWQDHATLLRLKDIAWAEADQVRRHYLWAPSMIAANGNYFLYYSIGPQDPTPSRLGVARCATPAGPCTDSGKPLLTGGKGFEAIDPMVFVDRRTGQRLLYAGGSAGARLRVFELRSDMVTIARELPIAQPPGFTEGVFLHERQGVYYLSYSHGHWNRADYSVRYATSASPTGPWTYRGVILSSQGRYKGPGHHAFVRDAATGAWLIVYHRWEYKTGTGPFHGNRRIAIQQIVYRGDGTIAPVDMLGDAVRRITPRSSIVNAR